MAASFCSCNSLKTWFKPVQETKKDQGRAFGHAGIVAAASAVLADLEKGGILKVGDTISASGHHSSPLTVFYLVYIGFRTCKSPQHKRHIGTPHLGLWLLSAGLACRIEEACAATSTSCPCRNTQTWPKLYPTQL